MEAISNIFVRPCMNCGNLKAVVSLAYYGLMIRGIKLMEGSKGTFLSMPARKRGEDWEDICFFLDQAVRDTVLNLVVQEYEKIQATD